MFSLYNDLVLTRAPKNGIVPLLFATLMLRRGRRVQCLVM